LRYNWPPVGLQLASRHIHRLYAVCLTMWLRQAAIGGLQDKTQGKLFEISHNDYVDEECDKGDNNPLSAVGENCTSTCSEVDFPQPCSANSTLVLYTIIISIVGT
jgi:hypothetical protein